MENPLDNASWHALTGPQRAFARVGVLAARYRPDISPIAALADDTDTAFAELAAMAAPGEVIVLPSERAFPTRGWEPIARFDVGQWLHDGSVAAAATDGIEELGRADREAMLALARLADPGPFELETWRLGTYLGIRANGELCAMAGERMRVPGFVEVSAVATRPGHEGRGHASRLVRALLARQRAAAERAFLHVRVGSPSERAATRVYEKLGFALRRMTKLHIARRLAD